MNVTAQTRMRRKPGANVRRRFLGLSRRTRQAIRVIAVIAIAFAIGSWFVGKLLRAVNLVGNEQRERDRLVTEYKALCRENAELRRRLHDLQTPRGIEREARKLGFVMPGETAVVVPDESKR